MYVTAIAELITFSWIYGVNRLCKDIEFMLGIKTGVYWRICWGIITPLTMIAIFIYELCRYVPLKYNNVAFPTTVYGRQQYSSLSFKNISNKVFYLFQELDGLYLELV